MSRTAKVTLSLPRELISFADGIAREKGISHSKVISTCLQDLADKQRSAEMAEGYKAMAKEQRGFAAIASQIEGEVLPEWK